MPHRTRRGFTLIELMCVLTIIAILVGLMLGPISRAYGKAKRLQWEMEAGTFVDRFHERLSERFGKLGPEVKYPALTAQQLYQARIISSDLLRFLQDKRVEFLPFSSDTPDETVILAVKLSKNRWLSLSKSDLRPPKD